MMQEIRRRVGGRGGGGGGMMKKAMVMDMEGESEEGGSEFAPSMQLAQAVVSWVEEGKPNPLCHCSLTIREILAALESGLASKL